MFEVRVHGLHEAFPPGGPDLYGMPRDPERALVHLLPVPFDATASYKAGAARGPEIVLRESHQLDLWDQDFGDALREGVHLAEPPRGIHEWQRRARRAAEPVHALAGDVIEAPRWQRRRRFVDHFGREVNRAVAGWTAARLEEGRLCGLVGGDHSVSQGSLAAHAARGRPFGILHLDAHADLRPTYQGFACSHASVMGNALRDHPEIIRLVQVGIRDVASEEWEMIRASGARIVSWPDRTFARARLEGTPFASLIPSILDPLPELVYVSFDIDGLDPALCPGTGTPVPGGLDLDQVALILLELVRSGRHVLGFDLVEVAPHPGDDGRWDGVVGARALLKLIGAAVASRGLGWVP